MVNESNKDVAPLGGKGDFPVVIVGNLKSRDQDNCLILNRLQYNRVVENLMASALSASETELVFPSVDELPSEEVSFVVTSEFAGNILFHRVFHVLVDFDTYLIM